jgi:hypothetical protein
MTASRRIAEARTQAFWAIAYALIIAALTLGAVFGEWT